MTLGLDIGLRGLRAAQAALDTVGHNLSNANTPGYTRQRVDLHTASPTNIRGNLFGTGVETDGVRRISDMLLSGRIRSQVAVFNGLEIQLQGMSRVEELLSEPGENGLGSLFDGFFGSVSRLSTNPGDVVLRNSMVQSGLNLTDEFNHLSSSLRDAREDNLQELAFYTGEANRLAGNILALNQEIVQAEAAQLEAHDLRDRREQELRNLAEQVDIEISEQPSGAMLVSVSGRVLVGTQSVQEISVQSDPAGEPSLEIDGSSRPLGALGGKIGGLLRFREEFLPELEAQLDELARNMILEVNRAHSTGTPQEGGFTLLSSTESVTGETQDERLATLLDDAGLPFEIREGRLFVNTTHAETGEVSVQSVAIDPSRMTVEGFLQALSGVEHMNAGLDSLGRLNLFSDSGYRFDFSARLDTAPDDFQTFGGGRATLGSSLTGPYNIGAGSTLTVQGAGGTATVTFQASEFVDIANATAAELAEAVNRNPAVATAGVRAVAVGERFVLQSINQGAVESVGTTGGSALAGLGFSPGTFGGGSDNQVQVTASGPYTGSENRTLYYEPMGDGKIGTTPGLQVRVTSADGSPVAVLDVGEGYAPGTDLVVGDGVSVSFGFGELSATDNQVFKQDWIADSDTTDALVAFGVNSFLTGSTAENVSVNRDIQDDPNRLSYSGSGSSGDNRALLQILSLQDTSVGSLGVAIPEYYSQVVGDVGFQVSTTQNATQVAGGLVESLDARRQEVSGVNVDEELVDMVRFEQAYSASARYIQVMQQLNDTILSIL